MNPSEPVCLGVVVGAKGLRGEVRIKSFTQTPADVASYGPVRTVDGRTFAIAVVAAAQGVVIAQLAGVVDRDQAEALKGAKLFVSREMLPEAAEGEVYHADLVGAEVHLAGGGILGKVSAVHNFGGGDMLEVGEGKDSVLIPLTPSVIESLDVQGRQVVVRAVPGLLDGAEG